MTDSRPVGSLALALLLAALGGLASCNRSDPGVAPAAAGSSAPKPGAALNVDPGVLAASRTMAAGVRMGTGTAPVEVRFDLATPPVQAQPFQVDVAVLPEATTPLLHVVVDGGSDLTVLAPDSPVAIEKVQAGTVEHLAVRATAAGAGTRVLTVKVTFDFPTGAESREFAFPLIVGAAPAPEPAPARGSKHPG
jgi:hypothetical protein